MGTTSRITKFCENKNIQDREDKQPIESLGIQIYDTGLITMKMRVWREKPLDTHHRGTCNQLACDGMPQNAN